ncbi:MAG: hypothetical protein H7222_00875 [Methylotenera sp.]|nr:hypothetical protein [Oligoflexia bacterium]
MTHGISLISGAPARDAASGRNPLDLDVVMACDSMARAFLLNKRALSK